MNKEMMAVPGIVRAVEDLAILAAEINAEHAAGETATRKSLEHYRRAGDKLLTAKEQCGHGKWQAWCKKNVRFSDYTAKSYMRIARNWDKIGDASDLREAHRLLWEDAQDDEEESLPPPDYVTLDQWNDLAKDAQRKLLRTVGDKAFNAQGDNENIEWALWSWNPVTGCLHNCPYCYARDIAERFYTQKFKPSLWPSRLRAPKNTPFPEHKAAEWMGHKNVFVCSMADLFGRWVPSEWIEAVLTEAKASPQWNFLFLTKFPQRLAEFEFADNAWVGTTVDCQARVANAEKAFRQVKAGIKWLSCEPLIEPLKFTDLRMFDWLVLGGASRSSQTPEWQPPLEWVLDIEHTAEKANCPIYYKTNLLRRKREYPGIRDPMPHEAPKELQYLPSKE